MMCKDYIGKILILLSFGKVISDQLSNGLLLYEFKVKFQRALYRSKTLLSH